MEVCTLPISGGGFPIQLTSCCILADVGYKPDLVFAASGGSLCAFIMLAGDWDSTRVPLIVENVSSKMFAEPWKIPVLDKLYSISQGSIFNNGKGGEELFLQLFDARKLQGIETWVGAYNKDLRRFKVMTNMAKDQTMLTMDDKHLLMNNLCSLDYASGNPVTMLKFIEASCSIPGVVPHKNIHGHGYVDGGVVCATPVSYFVQALIGAARAAGKQIHFTCHTCEDINASNGGSYRRDTSDDGSGHLIESMMDIFMSMLNASLIRDRVACGDVLIFMGSTLLGYVTFRASNVNMQHLKKFKEAEGNCGGTVSEMFCNKVNSYMDMAHFDGQMSLQAMDYSYEHMLCRVWIYCNGTPSKVLGSESLQWLRTKSVEDQLPD